MILQSEIRSWSDSDIRRGGPKSAPALRLRSAQAFTLIELLVVITIMTVLMSMLIPAIEDAVYQAQLVTCEANLKAVAASATLYANDNQLFYPKRHPDYIWDALFIIQAYPDPDGFDFRPKWTPYMPLQCFVEPLLPEQRFDDASLMPDSHVLIAFNIYTGLQRGAFDDANAEAMDRLGQRFNFTDTKSPGGAKEYRFSVVAGDRDMYQREAYPFGSASSHPDRSARRLLVARYKRFPPSGTTAGFILPEWSKSGSLSRPVDLNYAYADGSVRRYDGVTENDERMAKIAATDTNEYVQGRFEHLPKEQ